MRILHIPTATEYEWLDYSTDFNSLNNLSLIYLNPYHRTAIVPVEEWPDREPKLTGAERRRIRKQNPSSYAFQYEFIVVEE